MVEKKKRGRPFATKQIDKKFLLDVAVKEFANHGYEGAKLKDIAEKADIAKSLLNYHFENKEDLWKQAVGQLGELLMQRFKDIQTYFKDLHGIAALKAYTRQYVYFSAEHPEFYKIVFHEMCTKTERADWFISNISSPIHKLLEQNTAASKTPEWNINGYPIANLSTIMMGASHLFFIHSYGLKKVYGIDPFDQTEIEKHADVVIELLFGSFKD